MSGSERVVQPEELRRLGFPDDLIAEAIEREARGTLAVEPPADLVQRTIDRCARLFATPAAAAADFRWQSFAATQGLRGVSDPAQYFAGMASGLCSSYFGSLDYALTSRQRPLVMLENHNVTELDWWKQDPVFRCMRHAAGTVNERVRRHGLDPSALVVVLRPQVKDYGAEELRTIGILTQEASSDVWWIPFRSAAGFARQDVVALGDESLLKIDGRADSPTEAIASLQTANDPKLVQEVRRDLLACISKATPVKIRGQLSGVFPDGHLTAETVRSALGQVILGSAPAAAGALPPETAADQARAGA